MFNLVALNFVCFYFEFFGIYTLTQCWIDFNWKIFLFLVGMHFSFSNWNFFLFPIWMSPFSFSFSYSNKSFQNFVICSRSWNGGIPFLFHCYNIIHFWTDFKTFYTNFFRKTKDESDNGKKKNSTGSTAPIFNEQDFVSLDCPFPGFFQYHNFLVYIQF